MFARTQGRSEFFYQCPKFYDELLTMNDNLTYESEPSYQKIYDILSQVCLILYMIVLNQLIFY